MESGLVALWGGEHPDLGTVAHAQLDQRSAVALTRGRFPKPAAHVDPNEDAVLAAFGARGRLLAVADGHFGFDAARAALAVVAARVPAMVGDPAEPPVEALERTCREALEAVSQAVAAAEPPRSNSRTALTLALVADQRLHVITYGDTVCLRERAGRAKAIGFGGWPFLGPGAGVPRVKRIRVQRTDRFAVASDGLSNYLGRHWPGRTASALAAAGDPVLAARGLVELAMDAGAGDNVAVGVLL